MGVVAGSIYTVSMAIQVGGDDDGDNGEVGWYGSGWGCYIYSVHGDTDDGDNEETRWCGGGQVLYI